MLCPHIENKYLIKGRHSSGNKVNSDSGQSKSKVCSYILKHRECNPLFVTLDNSCKLYFRTGQYFVAAYQQLLILFVCLLLFFCLFVCCCCCCCFFAFPSYISGVHTLLGKIFAYVTVFFNPTIKVVTFRLRGWCVLGVFLLPAFTRLGHERQDLLSPCDEMHVCTD